MSTEYRTIERFPNYKFDNYGNSFSMKSNTWLKIKPNLGSNNRYNINIRINGKKYCYTRARIICEAFHGPCPEGMECCHNDGNTLNDNESNLRWDTPKNNQKDRIKHGTYQYGENNPKAKFKKEDILNIRYLNNFCDISEIVSIYKVSRKTISRIIKMESYTNV